MAEQKELTPEEYQDNVKEFGQTQVPAVAEENPRGNVMCMTIIG